MKTRKLRLAVFTNQFPARVSTFFARDMRALLEAGFDIEIFPFYPLDPNFWRYVPDILSETVLPRTKIHHISIGKILSSPRQWPLAEVKTFLQDTAAISVSAATSGVGSLAKNAYVFLKAWAWAQEFRHEYDHILAYWGNYSATCAYIFHRLIGQPIPYSMFLHAGIDLYHDQVFLRQKLLYADNIFVVCNFNRQFIHERYNDIFESISEKIHTHHLGLDFATFPFARDGRPPNKVVAVGRADKQKGFEYLLHAAHDLRCRGLDIEIEFIGPDKDAATLKALANNLRLGEKVNFRGWLNFDEVRTAMLGATILVHPSTELWDAVPTVIKESMALGTPVIGSNVAGIPELLDGGRCGVLVPPKDSKALANAIETLIFNQELRRNYADAARKYAELTFDLWRNGQRLADILCSKTREMKQEVNGNEATIT